MTDDINLNNLEKYMRNIIEDKYKLFVCDRPIMLQLFKLYITYYKKHHKKQKRTAYVGIDYEFNQRKIALMQINFGDTIWLLNPSQFDEETKKCFVQKILINKRIYKILHGSDSLDLPYIYGEL